jgi:hypothetical protein
MKKPTAVMSTQCLLMSLSSRIATIATHAPARQRLIGGRLWR